MGERYCDKKDRPKLPGPSMTHFYDNLKRISRDGFWLLNDANPFTVEDKEFRTIAGALMYDYTGLQSMAEQRRTFTDRVRLSLKNGGDRRRAIMSVQAWLEEYDNGDRIEDEEEEKSYVAMKRKRASLDFFDFLRLMSEGCRKVHHIISADRPSHSH